MSSRLRVFGVALLVLWRVLCVFAVGVVCRRFGLRVLFLILSYPEWAEHALHTIEGSSPWCPESSPRNPSLVRIHSHPHP